MALTGDKESGVLLRAAETLATEFGAQLRLVSFAVQLSPPETARFRTEGAAVTAEWTENIRSAAQEALDAERKLGKQGLEPSVVIGHGEDWKEAFEDVEWLPGDVLVVGSSDSGPVARVFLGSRANKIVRHSPVPVLGVPRTAAKGARPNSKSSQGCSPKTLFTGEYLIDQQCGSSSRRDTAGRCLARAAEAGIHAG